jgi:hypothetical protein
MAVAFLVRQKLECEDFRYVEVYGAKSILTLEASPQVVRF